MIDLVVDRRELKDDARARAAVHVHRPGAGHARRCRPPSPRASGEPARPPPRDPRAWLTSLEHFGIKLGLSSIQRDLRRRSAIPSGSSARSTSPAPTAKARWPRWWTRRLRAAGHRVGRYTSPHLVRLEERFTVDGRAGERRRARRGARDRPRGRRRGCGPPARSRRTPRSSRSPRPPRSSSSRVPACEVAVLEVGLGGRFDATNVVEPVVAAITSIALDHEQHLGTTLEAIAFEKAGIIKPGVPWSSGRCRTRRCAWSSGVCDERGAPLHDAVGGVHRRHARGSKGGRCFTSRRRDASTRRLVLALRGDHQVQNAVVAVRLLETARRPRRERRARRRSLPAWRGARWPARLDLVDAGGGRKCWSTARTTPPALRRWRRTFSRSGRRVCRSCSARWETRTCAGMLRPLAAVARPLILTTAPGSRAADAQHLAAVARSRGHRRICSCARTRRGARGRMGAGPADRRGRLAVPRGPRAGAARRRVPDAAAIAGGLAGLGRVIFCGGLHLLLHRTCASRVPVCPVMRHTPGILIVLCLALSAARARCAQELGGCQTSTSKQWTIERLGKDHVKLVGQVEVICTDETFFADEIEIFNDQDRLIATGNVVFTSGTSRIAADRLDFNTRTKTGTFYNASGSATLAAPPTAQRRRPVRARARRRTQHVRHAGARRLLLRRDAAEARRAEVQDHARRLHDVRAADARAGS